MHAASSKGPGDHSVHTDLSFEAAFELQSFELGQSHPASPPSPAAVAEPDTAALPATPATSLPAAPAVADLSPALSLAAAGRPLSPCPVGWDHILASYAKEQDPAGLRQVPFSVFSAVTLVDSIQ